jgi:hypothetical protein
MNTVWRPVPNLSAMLRTPSFLRLKSKLGWKNT